MGQKSRFKAQQTGTFIKRNAFPQIPGTTLADPKFITTSRGGKLLISGWWGVLRKPSASPLSSRQKLTRDRLHVGLDPGSLLGTVSGSHLAYPVLLSRVPLDDAPPPQLAGQRAVCSQVRCRLARVPASRTLHVSLSPPLARLTRVSFIPYVY